MARTNSLTHECSTVQPAKGRIKEQTTFKKMSHNRPVGKSVNHPPHVFISEQMREERE